MPVLTIPALFPGGRYHLAQILRTPILLSGIEGMAYTYANFTDSSTRALALQRNPQPTEHATGPEASGNSFL